MRAMSERGRTQIQQIQHEVSLLFVQIINEFWLGENRMLYESRHESATRSSSLDDIDTKASSSRKAKRVTTYQQPSPLTIHSLIVVLENMNELLVQKILLEIESFHNLRASNAESAVNVFKEQEILAQIEQIIVAHFQDGIWAMLQKSVYEFL